MIRFVVVCLALLAVAAAAPARAAAPPASRQIFEHLILERISAFANGDAAAYTALLADEFVHISDSGTRRTRADIDAYVSANAGAGTSIAYRVEDLQWQRFGDHVVVDCVIVEQSPAGEGRFRESNLFRRDADRWLFTRHQETPIVEVPDAVAIDPARLSDYVGRYDFGHGLFDTVAQRDEALYVSDGGEPSLLIPIAPDTFAVSGAPGVLVFVRDHSGKVAGEVHIALNGKVATSRRLDASTGE